MLFTWCSAARRVAGDFGSPTRASLMVMLLPRFHRLGLSLVAGLVAAVACLLAGRATSDVAQCVWALSAGISLAVAAAAWWPTSLSSAPRPPAQLDVLPSVEVASKRDADAVVVTIVDTTRAA